MKVQYHFPFHITQNLERDEGPPNGSVSKIILFFNPPPPNDCFKNWDDQKCFNIILIDTRLNSAI
jgi:hypothetical protein